MKMYDIGLSVSDSITNRFTESLHKQISLVWEQMWETSCISGATRLFIKYNAKTILFGTVSFDLPGEIVDVSVAFMSKDTCEISMLRQVLSGKKHIRLKGLSEKFAIRLIDNM